MDRCALLIVRNNALVIRCSLFSSFLSHVFSMVSRTESLQNFSNWFILSEFYEFISNFNDHKLYVLTLTLNQSLNLCMNFLWNSWTSNGCTRHLYLQILPHSILFRLFFRMKKKKWFVSRNWPKNSDSCLFIRRQQRVVLTKEKNS